MLSESLYPIIVSIPINTTAFMNFILVKASRKNQLHRLLHSAFNRRVLATKSSKRQIEWKSKSNPSTILSRPLYSVATLEVSREESALDKPILRKCAKAEADLD